MDMKYFERVCDEAQFIEPTIADKTQRIRDLVRCGLTIQDAKNQVLADRIPLNIFARKAIEKRVRNMTDIDLTPPPKSFWQRWFG